MTLDEYYKWQKALAPKVLAESTKKRVRAEVRATIKKAVALAEGKDVTAAIDKAYPFKKVECARHLIWLQERRAILLKLKLIDF